GVALVAGRARHASAEIGADTGTVLTGTTLTSSSVRRCGVRACARVRVACAGDVALVAGRARHASAEIGADTGTVLTGTTLTSSSVRRCGIRACPRVRVACAGDVALVAGRACHARAEIGADTGTVLTGTTLTSSSVR